MANNISIPVVKVPYHPWKSKLPSGDISTEDPICHVHHVGAGIAASHEEEKQFFCVDSVVANSSPAISTTGRNADVTIITSELSKAEKIVYFIQSCTEEARIFSAFFIVPISQSVVFVWHVICYP
jgi:hypothetical protein